MKLPGKFHVIKAPAFKDISLKIRNYAGQPPEQFPQDNDEKIFMLWDYWIYEGIYEDITEAMQDVVLCMAAFFSERIEECQCFKYSMRGRLDIFVGYEWGLKINISARVFENAATHQFPCMEDVFYKIKEMLTLPQDG